MNWKPYDEPLRATLTRTVMIAAVAGVPFAFRLGGLEHWPKAALLMLWPSFGGHWVEIFFLNYLRPRLPDARAVQAGVRVAVWFLGGVGLLYALRMSAGPQPARWPAWWAAGLAFIGVELAVHLVMQLRGRPSFFNGRG